MNKIDLRFIPLIAFLVLIYHLHSKILANNVLGFKVWNKLKTRQPSISDPPKTKWMKYSQNPSLQPTLQIQFHVILINILGSIQGPNHYEVNNKINVKTYQKIFNFFFVGKTGEMLTKINGKKKHFIFLFMLQNTIFYPLPLTTWTDICHEISIFFFWTGKYSHWNVNTSHM